MNKPLLVDLFCGAGGLSHGFQQAGFSIHAGIDFDKDSIDTFKHNHPDSKALVQDLSTKSPEKLAFDLDIKPGMIDCLAGGPPCQGFSKNRAFRHKDGIFVDDPRNHLYWYFFEFVRYFRPKVVVMENVPEMLIKANGEFRDAVFEKFHKLGYHAEAHIINAAEYSVPQARRRAVFLAGRDGTRIPFPEATSIPGPRAGNRTTKSLQIIEKMEKPSLFGPYETGFTVWDAIGDLRGSYPYTFADVCGYAQAPFSAYQRDRRDSNLVVHNHFPWKLTERQLQRVRLLSQGQGHDFLPAELQVKEGYGSAYRRLQADAQALTITTWMFHPGSGMFVHPYEDRAITVREAARIQSFQDDFVFYGRYHSQCKQVGNAVAPLVAKKLALSIQAVLGL